MTHSGVLRLVIGDEELLVARGVTAAKDLVVALLARPLCEFHRLSGAVLLRVFASVASRPPWYVRLV